jgi:hypothetical protein
MNIFISQLIYFDTNSLIANKILLPFYTTTLSRRYGMVVIASASGAEDRRFESRWREKIMAFMFCNAVVVYPGANPTTSEFTATTPVRMFLHLEKICILKTRYAFS